ncbi:SRPBCC domain-containing protein [Bacteriovorax sp. DB6_IX]|uniref:SRPBCC family protein n=1 Tax=Bacteriovorax sp. DB6_IX TaxID=1353530 RepID=UPI00038A28B4|nr:SRPBCC domain-containing protein [Bacteriovorax sp. DB6_IX]EQC52081.1 hypothetical protein M901_1359 [Bacteriovorax sp. DB6_IX]
MEFIYNKTFAVPPKELFEDFSSVEKMKAWMIKGDNIKTEADCDFCPGGKYHIEMVSTIGDVSHYYGEYTQINKNQHIDMVWHDGEVQNTLVSFDFYPTENNGTKLRITHANLPNKMTFRHHREFWKSCLEHLEDYVKKSA